MRVEADGKAALSVVIGGQLAGILAVADTVKDGAAEAVARQVGRECMLDEVCLAAKEAEAAIDQGVGHDGAGQRERLAGVLTTHPYCATVVSLSVHRSCRRC